MQFQSERSAITLISDAIVKSGVSLYNAVITSYSIHYTKLYDLLLLAVQNIIADFVEEGCFI